MKISQNKIITQIVSSSHGKQPKQKYTSAQTFTGY